MYNVEEHDPTFFLQVHNQSYLSTGVRKLHFPKYGPNFAMLQSKIELWHYVDLCVKKSTSSARTKSYQIQVIRASSHSNFHESKSSKKKKKKKKNKSMHVK